MTALNRGIRAKYTGRNELKVISMMKIGSVSSKMPQIQMFTRTTQDRGMRANCTHLRVLYIWFHTHPSFMASPMMIKFNGKDKMSMSKSSK